MRSIMNSRLGWLVGLALAALVYVVHPAAALAAPAMLGATTEITDMDEALKIFFNDPIVYNTVTDSDVLDLFTVDNAVQYEQTTGGRYIETAQYFQLPAGVGARANSEYIPVPNGPVIKNSRVYLKKIQGVVEMEGDVMERCRGDMGAYLNWMERALPDLVTRLKDSADRMALGYGAGIKAMVNDATPAADLIIDNTFGISAGIGPLTQPWLLFLEGESIVFGSTAAMTTLRGSSNADRAAIVEGIDVATNTITLDHLPTGVVDNDFIAEGDAAGFGGPTAAGDDREFMGLLGMVDDGSVLAEFQGLVRADYRLWNSMSFDAANAAIDAEFDGSLNETLLTYADDETFVHGGGKVDTVLTSRGGLRSYWKKLRTDRTINDPRAFMGGKGKLSIILGDRSIELRAARKLPQELTFGLQRDTFKRWELDGYKWDDRTGAIWNRVTDGTGRKDAFYAVGNWYMQLGCLAPRKNFRIHSIDPTV
jgi:hypothetical protein